MKKYLASRTDDNDKLFRIGHGDPFNKIWQKATKAVQIKISPQILRKWHSTELGELMVPDRFDDVFQGRAPRTVIDKHYTGKGLEMLKRICDKAGLKVLN